MNKYHTSNKYYRLWLFWVGVIATVSYRAIILLNNINTTSVKVAWYIGTIGFIWYFAHRYRVQNYRQNLIKEKKLVEKVCENNLNKEDCDALQYILKSLRSTKAKWNYIAIFFFSIIALLYGIYEDFILKLLN